MGANVRRAWKETFGLLGGSGIVFAVLAIPCVGFLLHFFTSGVAAMMGEFQVWLIYSAAATGVVFVLLFFVNLLRSPYLIERDAHA
jgi:hypothetical protein